MQSRRAERGLVRLLRTLRTLESAEASPAAPCTAPWSDESPSVLWEHEDNVTWLDGGRQRDVYVIVRHFKHGRLGTHVRLAQSNGRVREYRLPAGSVAGEHVCVYIFNPAVHGNGALRLRCGGGEVVVEEDTCQVVCTVALADMKGAVAVRVQENSRDRIAMRFYFGPDCR
jgi:hypothetical protein